MTVLLVSHPDCEGYDPGRAHPDRPERLWTISDRLIASGLDVVLDHAEAPLAGREDLALVHDAAYIDRIFALEPDEGEAWIDEDTWMVPGTLAAARRSAGAALLAVDAVLAGEATRAFCRVRPPGHHATRDRAMGFCFFNNAALAAAHALARHGLARVAIADFDAHHGNGTEDIFSGEPRVLVCSSFQHPFYPFTGHDSSAANLVAVPLPAATGGAGFRERLEAHWRPALAAFRPELVVVSAGFDAHVEDSMSALALTETDFAWATRLLAEAADASAGGRIVSVLEGGYEPDALARSVVTHLRALLP